MHTKLKYMFETMELDGCIIAVPVGELASKYHGVIKLNDTGAAILEMLKEEISETEIINALIKRYDVPVEKLSADVQKFISVFQEHDMLA